MAAPTTTVPLSPTRSTAHEPRPEASAAREPHGPRDENGRPGLASGARAQPLN